MVLCSYEFCYQKNPSWNWDILLFDLEIMLQIIAFEIMMDFGLDKIYAKITVLQLENDTCEILIHFSIKGRKKLL